MPQYELAIVSDKEGTLVINNYELLQDEVAKYIANRPLLIISDKSDYKLVKEFRTEINKLSKAIKDGRLQTTRDLLSVFEEQCKTLEKQLDDHSKALGETLRVFDENNGKIKPKKYSVTLSFYDEKIIDKLKTFAEKNGCEMTIKE